jgi:TPP-dependent pyruvate/acetoin dehydrogenase alpha subunit
MHLAAPDKGHMCSSAIVASCIPVAVGAAFANNWKKNGQISCVFFGDGALDEGVFWESLNVACLMELPVLFVCEDNDLAVHTPKHSRQGYKSITDIVSQFDCVLFETDSTEVETIYQLSLKAAESIRTKKKPAFLYLKCYRYLEHVGINEDFQAGYRSKTEFEEWYERDALVQQREKLIGDGMVEAEIQKIESRIEARIEKSVKRAKEAPFPKPSELYRGVFHEKN